jgi:uncharacterized protein (DUF58 family)
VPRLTARGLAVFAVFVLVVVAATLTTTPELAPLAVVVGVPLLLGPWLAGRRARAAVAAAEFHAHVEPGTVEVGGEMQVHLSVTHRVRNRAPGRTQGRTRSAASLPPLGLAPVGPHWRARGVEAAGIRRRGRLAPSAASLLLLPSPAPGQTGTGLFPVPTGRRGVFELHPQPTWTTDPFGLFGAAGPSTPTVIAVVHPVPVLPREPLPELTASRSGADRLGPSRSGGGVGDLEGIRPYVVGDRLSLLHWPAKARYGSWFVREFGTEEAVAVSLVIDDRVGVHRRSEFEQLIATALWILTAAAESGRSGHLLTLSGRQYTFGPGDRGCAEARLALSELQPVGTVAWPRQPSLPRNTVLLTTGTGADRLAPPGTSTPPSEGAGIGAGLSGARVVVV